MVLYASRSREIYQRFHEAPGQRPLRSPDVNRFHVGERQEAAGRNPSGFFISPLSVFRREANQVNTERQEQ